MKLSTYVEELPGGDVRVHTWRIVGVIAAVVLVCGGLTFATWGLGIVTAPWVGRQNAHRIINNPTNQIFQYEHFFTLDADIHADSHNLVTEEKQLRSWEKLNPPGTPDPAGSIANETATIQSTITGTSTHCEGLVTTYNNDGREYTKNTFLSHQLPSEEDATLCEVTQ